MLAGEEELEPKQTLDSILGKWSRGEKKQKGLQSLAKLLKEIDSRLDFKQSARGWCYTLENENIIDKGDFDRAEKYINECRKKGFLDIDFCADDTSRAWDNVEEPTGTTIQEHFKQWVSYALRCNEAYIPDWLEGEEYYIQMLVEKVDLKSLFTDLCAEYHIPIANSKGWSDLNIRDQIASRFKPASDRGLKCVLLYCGDHDPWGLQIGSRLKKHIAEIKGATGYDPYNKSNPMILDRFGLNYEFIVENHLTWIDNLKSGSKGGDMTKSRFCKGCKMQYPAGTIRCHSCNRKLYQQPQFVLDYIEKYGVRKVEANALVAAPDAGRELAEQAIIKYLGQDAKSRFEDKRQKIKREFDRLRLEYPLLIGEMENLVRG